MRQGQARRFEQLCLMKLPAVMEMFTRHSLIQQALAMSTNWALSMWLVQMRNSIFNLINLYLNSNSYMWLVATILDKTGGNAASTGWAENFVNINLEEKFKRGVHLLALLGISLICNTESNIVLGHSKSIEGHHSVILCFLQCWSSKSKQESKHWIYNSQESVKHKSSRRRDTNILPS